MKAAKPKRAAKTALKPMAVRALVTWIGQNVETESGFLTPYPGSTVNAHALLDEIHELSGIPKETLGEWIDEARKEEAQPD